MKNDYEIRGEITAIFMKRKDGSILETIINTSDLEKVKEFPNTWYAYFSGITKTFYVSGNSKTINGKRKSVYLHRYIFDNPENLFIDHINHDTLNNTKVNLRIATRSQNAQNRRGASRNSKSGIIGVTWKNRNKKWQSAICINGKQLYLGLFENIKEAEKVVIEARKKLMPFSKEAIKKDQ